MNYKIKNILCSFKIHQNCYRVIRTISCICKTGYEVYIIIGVRKLGEAWSIVSCMFTNYESNKKKDLYTSINIYVKRLAKTCEVLCKWMFEELLGILKKRRDIGWRVNQMICFFTLLEHQAWWMLLMLTTDRPLHLITPWLPVWFMPWLWANHSSLGIPIISKRSGTCGRFFYENFEVRVDVIMCGSPALVLTPGIPMLCQPLFILFHV